MLVGHGVLAEDDPGSRSNRPLRHLGVLAAAQPEAVVEQRLDAGGDLVGEDESTRRRVLDGGAGRVPTPGEEGRVDPSGVTPLEHRLHHPVDHVGVVPDQRVEHRHQPVRLDGHVVVEEGEEVAGVHRGHGAVARGGDPWLRLGDVAHGQAPFRGGGDLVGGASGVVVDDEHADRAAGRDVEPLDRLEEPGQGFLAPEGDDADGHVE